MKFFFSQQGSTLSTETITKPLQNVSLNIPWNVVVHDDPVNLMGYVTLVLRKIFGYDENKASVLMMQVHNHGHSVVWTGEREMAEFFMQQLQAHQLKTSLEKAE